MCNLKRPRDPKSTKQNSLCTVRTVRLYGTPKAECIMNEELGVHTTIKLDFSPSSWLEMVAAPANQRSGTDPTCCTTRRVPGGEASLRRPSRMRAASIPLQKRARGAEEYKLVAKHRAGATSGFLGVTEFRCMILGMGPACGASRNDAHAGGAPAPLGGAAGLRGGRPRPRTRL